MPAPRTTASPRTSAPRRELTPREAEALRALLAARAAGTPGTATARPATARPVARTTSAGKKKTARKKARRAPARRPASAPRERGPWRTRLLVVGLATLLVPAVSVLLAPATSAPGSATIAPDPTGLALAARSTLLQDADAYRRLQAEIDGRRAELATAEAAELAARAAVAAEQVTVGDVAADLYRASATGRMPVLGLEATTPGTTSGVLQLQALADRAAVEREAVVVRAQRAEAAAEAAAARVSRAQAAVDAATAQARTLLAGVRETADDLGLDVAAQLAALDTVPSAGAQQQRNAAALQRWQGYLAELASAGIEPPSAAELADPAALPAGFSPALDAAGQAVPGVAWAVAGNRPVTVLPAETVAAVSSALAQAGRPYAEGSAGPDAYDCGGLTAASWLLAGYDLPATAAGQWAAATVVPASQIQVGDLVVSDGGQDVALYLGSGEVLGASAATYRVGVHPLPEDARAVRVTLPAPAQPNAPLPATASGRGACGAPPAPAGPVSPAWGGWTNGRIPAEALCSIARGHALRCDAAAGYAALASAYEAEFGTPLCITDSYRSMAAQQDAFRRKPALAAVPGTSNHGWALAVDLCGGVHVAGTAQWTWMTQNAGRFGFVNPDWARPGGEKPEPWHWEFGDLLD
ncbi:NlpC/P60 family protein [Geodermatophilus nigrescens]|uniref:Cell wall-associated hydrolase, NlpC family n=1 Tax=Geodermatophilus nigrescens TaxID=1070870 RepID=A0A1M5EDP9_9ACTN|nr:NlpC/P60 family protein [Geodermatophilus nigrescens]SHF77222.1 Cell wall-associated hydrolase, NlpC family [Geodermatophilus nigrescens]